MIHIVILVFNQFWSFDLTHFEVFSDVIDLLPLSIVLRSTSHPRIAHGQRYPMPCLEWLAEEVEWEQGSSPKGPMSCRTQVNFHKSWAIIHDIQWELCIFFNFLSICHVNFSFYQFSMLFNGNHTFFAFFFNFLSICHIIQ